jgi:16S rRNA (cytosine967-C5)-methyltransferase
LSEIPPAPALPVLDPRILELVLSVRREQLESGRSIRKLLAEVLPQLGAAADERRAIARICYRLERLSRLIDFSLDGAHRGRREPDADGIERARYFAAALLGGDIDEAEAGRQAPRVDWMHVRFVGERIASLEDPARRFATTHSMPTWLARRFMTEFGEHAEPLAACLNTEPPLTIRTNTLRITDRDALATELEQQGLSTKPTRYAPHGLHVEDAVVIFAIDAFHRGFFEQQDEASQLCCQLVAPPPRGRVLDACAGAGGKTLALAAALANKGDILAVDPHEGRLQSLVERRRRAGTDNVRSLLIDKSGWPTEVEQFAKSADRILLDVPCSGIGSWRRRPDARWRARPVGFERLLSTQSELLTRGLACLAPGARLVYSTCSLFGDENRAQVEVALERDRDLELVRAVEILGKGVGAPISDTSGTFLELWPHIHGTDGFFAAVFRRKR